MNTMDNAADMNKLDCIDDNDSDSDSDTDTDSAKFKSN